MSYTYLLLSKKTGKPVYASNRKNDLFWHVHHFNLVESEYVYYVIQGSDIKVESEHWFRHECRNYNRVI